MRYYFIEKKNHIPFCFYIIIIIIIIIILIFFNYQLSLEVLQVLFYHILSIL